MPHQSAVTVLATVPPARVDDVREVLDEAHRKGAGEVFRFAEVKGALFARLVLVPQGPDSAGALLPAGVVCMSEMDVSPSAHLADLVRSTTISTVDVALTLLARRRNCCRPATR
ncbi:hypothetical protein AB0D83_18825 [Streptomyces decoyicus]|uniref:hypothetical protein n=1 Tax=Streptomyces decoyicus TaxID=249567 RepID=UPI00340BEAB4